MRAFCTCDKVSAGAVRSGVKLSASSCELPPPVRLPSARAPSAVCVTGAEGTEGAIAKFGPPLATGPAFPALSELSCVDVPVFTTVFAASSVAGIGLLGIISAVEYFGTPGGCVTQYTSPASPTASTNIAAIATTCRHHPPRKDASSSTGRARSCPRSSDV